MAGEKISTNRILVFTEAGNMELIKKYVLKEVRHRITNGGLHRLPNAYYEKDGKLVCSRKSMFYHT